MRTTPLFITAALVAGLMWASPAPAQDVDFDDLPPEVEQELDDLDMTPEEARQEAERLGIDPNDPDQASRRAQELGVPQARVQAIMDAIEEDDETVDTDDDPMVMRPSLSGEASLMPETVRVEDLPETVRVRVPLRAETEIDNVRPFLVREGAERQDNVEDDTLEIDTANRVSGTRTDGVWEGEVRLPRDMSPSSFVLRADVTDVGEQETTLSTNQRLRVETDRVDEPEEPEEDVAPREALEHFGYDLFESIPDAFAPDPTATPVDDGYIIGPQDRLRLTAWGATEFQHDLTVDSQGRVYVPNVGMRMVAGTRLSELRLEMREWLSQSYSGLTGDNPSIQMDLTVSEMRPVRVFVLGEVDNPGGYTVRSGSTVFNALYSIGGPLERGTLRDIKLIRDGEIVETIDLYEYIMRGHSGSNEPIRLQNNDHIYVPPRGKTVGLRGEVTRPAYFEMQDDETFADLIEYAGGFETEAYTSRFHVERIVPFDDREDPSVGRRTIDVDMAQVEDEDGAFELADGDFITVPSIRELEDRVIAPRLNAVRVDGAVFQPGQYELGDDVQTVRDLVEKADGLTGDAYRPQAELVRLEDDLNESTRMLDLEGVMEDDPRENLPLQPGDRLEVFSIQDLQVDRTVRISGEVLEPGSYTYRREMTVEDLLFKAGGLTDDEFLKDVFLQRADLYREAADGRSEEVIPFHLGEALEGNEFADEPLQPGDEIRVYPLDVEVERNQFAEISGAVEDPGRYDLRDNLTLKDLILQAEGFQEGAFLRTVEITRQTDEPEPGERAQTLQVPLVERGMEDDVSFAIDDTLRALEAADEFDVEHRDRVFVRTDPDFQEQQTVTVEGEVEFPGEYTLREDNERLSDVIARAGGVLDTGYPGGGRLMRNGEQVVTDIDDAIEGEARADLRLEPGDEIRIPTQPNTVAVRGNVANEGLFRHEEGERVTHYLDRAGGELDHTERILLTQASGATFEVSDGWFRRTPQVEDGAVIEVVEEPPEEREPVDIGEIAENTLSVVTSALTLILLIDRVGN